jgi:O-antigen ligase
MTHLQRSSIAAIRPVIADLTRPLLVIVLGFMLARFVLESSGYLVLALMGSLVLGFILLRNLQPGLVVYFLIAGLAFGESPGVQSPHSGYSAGAMPSQLLLGFLTMLWFARALFAEGFRFAKSDLNRPLLALGLVALASLLTNNVLRGTRELLFHQLLITQIAEVALLGCSICAFFLVANALRSAGSIRAAVVPVILLGLYFAAHRIVGFELPIPMPWGSFILAAALSLVYARLLFGRHERKHRIGLSLLFAVLLIAAYKNLSWISGCVAASGAIMVVSWYRSRPLAIILLMLVLIALFVYPGIYASIHEESETGGDFDRFIIWQDAFRMFMAVSPLLGIGPGNYHPYIYYHGTIWYGSGTYTTAHSNYAQMAAELGLVGLAVFIWVVVSGIRAGHSAVRNAPSDLRWLAVGATAFFASMAVSSLFGDYLFPSRGNNGIVNFGTTVYAWLILGAAVAAANLDSESRPESVAGRQLTRRPEGEPTILR